MPQFTPGMPSAGPSSQPFTNPTSFAFAHSTIPSFPLGPQSFTTPQPQTTTPFVGKPFLPSFQMQPPPPPSNPLPPIINYFTMPPLSRNPLPFAQTSSSIPNYLAPIFTQARTLPIYVGQNPSSQSTIPSYLPPSLPPQPYQASYIPSSYQQKTSQQM